MVVKLRELFNTRFLYRTFCEDLRNLFRNVVTLREDPSADITSPNELHNRVYTFTKCANPVQFDLADTKISPDVTPIIMEYTRKGIEFVDTKDPLRNEIMKINRERCKAVVTNTTPLPEFVTDTSLKDYLNSLSKEVVYVVPNSNDDVYIPLTYLISVCRPSVQLDVNSVFNRLLTFVASHFTVDELCKYKNFYYVTQHGIREVDYSNGTISTQKFGDVDMMQALTCGMLVPTVFGRERLIDKEVWKDIAGSCLRKLNNYRATNKLTLADFYFKENKQ